MYCIIAANRFNGPIQNTAALPYILYYNYVPTKQFFTLLSSGELNHVLYCIMYCTALCTALHCVLHCIVNCTAL